MLLVATSCADFLTHHAHDTPLVSCSPDLHVPIVVRSTRSAGSGATPEYLHSKLEFLRFVGPLIICLCVILLFTQLKNDNILLSNAIN